MSFWCLPLPDIVNDDPFNQRLDSFSKSDVVRVDEVIIQFLASFKRDVQPDIKGVINNIAIADHRSSCIDRKHPGNSFKLLGFIDDLSSVSGASSELQPHQHNVMDPRFRGSSAKLNSHA